MLLGLSSYTLTWSVGVPGYEHPVNLIDAVDLIHITYEHGLKLLQIADNIPLHMLNDRELERIKETSLRLDVQLEIGTRGTEPSHLLQYLRIAKYLNARLIRTLITDPDLQLPLEQLLEVLPHYQEAGITIGIENHGLHTTKQLAELFAAIDNPHIGCCLDTVNSFSALDNPETVIRDLSPYLVNLHIKDFDITRVDHQMGFVILGKPAGLGRLDIPKLLSCIDSNCQTTAILELWTPFTHTVEETILLEREWMGLSLAYLRSLPRFDTQKGAIL